MTPLTISRPPAAAGILWIKEGWRLFRKAPIPWMGMTALMFMVIIGVNLIPWIGHYAVELLSPFLVAGYLAASRAAQDGEPVTFLHLGAGMRNGRDALLRIGAAYLIVSLLIFALVGLVTGSDPRALLLQAQDSASLSPDEFNRLITSALPSMLLAMILFTPLILATWFAPGLALFEAFPARRALWWSLWACWVNWRPILYYSLVLGLFGTLALIIPFGLGMLVLLPLTLTSTYVAYRTIFTPGAVMETEASP